MVVGMVVVVAMVVGEDVGGGGGWFRGSDIQTTLEVSPGFTLGWSDLALFYTDFRNWTHCCRSRIFLGSLQNCDFRVTVKIQNL